MIKMGYDSSSDGAAARNAEFAEFLSRLVNGDIAAWSRFIADGTLNETQLALWLKANSAPLKE